MACAEGNKRGDRPAVAVEKNDISWFNIIQIVWLAKTSNLGGRSNEWDNTLKARLSWNDSTLNIAIQKAKETQHMCASGKFPEDLY